MKECLVMIDIQKDFLMENNAFIPGEIRNLMNK